MERIHQKILQCQYLSEKHPFGGLIGPGNSTNLYNFPYRFETLRVHVSFHVAHGFLMRCYQRRAGYFHLPTLCNVIPHFAFAYFSHFLVGLSSGWFILLGV